MERQVGLLEERIRSLERAAEMPKAVTALEAEMEVFSADEERIKREIAEEKESLILTDELIKEIEKSYLQALLAIKLPGMNEDDHVEINRTTWIPYILPHGRQEEKWDFYNAGSGGKKTLLNVCYALSVHKAAAETKSSSTQFSDNRFTYEEHWKGSQQGNLRIVLQLSL